MTTMNQSSYIRFLNCIDALEEKGGVKKLDAIETQLLDWVILVRRLLCMDVYKN